MTPTVPRCTAILLACSICAAPTAAAQRPANDPAVFSAAADSTLPVAPLLRLSYGIWGGAIGGIDSAIIANSTAATFSELLQAQLPGLRVLRQGGAVTD